jgi:hypothetical protein
MVTALAYNGFPSIKEARDEASARHLLRLE